MSSTHSFTPHPLAVYFLVALLAFFAACGFKLRTFELGANIAIDGTSDSLTVTTLKTLLSRAGGYGAGSEDATDYRLVIDSETLDKHVLSVSPTTGKVLEYEMTLTVAFTILNDEFETVARDVISTSGDYTFNAQAVLGKQLEETELHAALADRVANSLIRRLQAVVR